MRVGALVLIAVWLAQLAPAPAAELLSGEFGDVDLGRQLIEPAKLPTVQELRAAVKDPKIQPVLMIKLFGNDKNHHLPIWAGDGQRLAFQRSEIDAKSSKLLWYPSLADKEPTPLSDEAEAYDYMFRWAANSPSSFAFVRIRPGSTNTQIYFCAEGGKPQRKTASDARYEYPAPYRRTDGIWRMTYQQDGRLMQESWNEEGPIDRPLTIVQGTTPRWSRDGGKLLIARQRPGRRAGAFDIVVWTLKNDSELMLPSDVEGVVRSPSWSPDEHSAAFYVRELGEGKPWRIRVCPAGRDAGGRTLGGNVVVNLNFDSEGPAWEPSGRRVWFFSEEHRKQAYYPLVAGDVQNGALTVIDYPNRCTTPNDLAINPATAAPEIAFVAHDGLPQDLFILFLNHY